MSQGPVQDEVIAKLRSAFLEIVGEYKVYTDEEKKEVIYALKLSWVFLFNFELCVIF